MWQAKKCRKNCAMSSSKTKHEAIGSGGEDQMENRWLVQHYMLLWMTGSPSQLTLHFWEAKTINILRKVTCESMQLPYYTEAIPLICKGWGVLLFAILFCITETCYSKRDAYIPILCTKKTIQLLFKHFIYFF